MVGRGWDGEGRGANGDGPRILGEWGGWEEWKEEWKEEDWEEEEEEERAF